jgi:hypothetical protein
MVVTGWTCLFIRLFSDRVNGKFHDLFECQSVARVLFVDRLIDWLNVAPQLIPLPQHTGRTLATKVAGMDVVHWGFSSSSNVMSGGCGTSS